MAITTVNIQKREESGSWTSEGKRKYTVVLQCLSNDPNDEAVTVLNAAADFLGIPVGTPTYVIYNIGNGSDSFAKLKTMTARCVAKSSPGEFKEWLVTLEYDSEAEQQQDNPLMRPTQISGSFQEYQKAIWKDRNGSMIVNKANQPFDPPIELPDARPVLTMTRNEVNYDMAYFAANFVNRINSTPWYGGATGQWRCANIAGAGPHVENDIVFYTLTYEFQFRYEGWQPQISNRGKKDKDGKPCVDANNNISDEPQLLKSDGTQVPHPVTLSAENFVTPLVFLEADFNDLALP